MGSGYLVNKWENTPLEVPGTYINEPGNSPTTGAIQRRLLAEHFYFKWISTATSLLSLLLLTRAKTNTAEKVMGTRNAHLLKHTATQIEITSLGN